MLEKLFAGMNSAHRGSACCKAAPAVYQTMPVPARTASANPLDSFEKKIKDDYPGALPPIYIGKGDKGAPVLAAINVLATLDERLRWLTHAWQGAPLAREAGVLHCTPCESDPSNHATAFDVEWCIDDALPTLRQYVTSTPFKIAGFNAQLTREYVAYPKAQVHFSLRLEDTPEAHTGETVLHHGKVAYIHKLALKSVVNCKDARFENVSGPRCLAQDTEFNSLDNKVATFTLAQLSADEMPLTGQNSPFDANGDMHLRLTGKLQLGLSSSSGARVSGGYGVGTQIPISRQVPTQSPVRCEPFRTTPVIQQAPIPITPVIQQAPIRAEPIVQQKPSYATPVGVPMRAEPMPVPALPVRAEMAPIPPPVMTK